MSEVHLDGKHDELSRTFRALVAVSVLAILFAVSSLAFPQTPTKGAALVGWVVFSVATMAENWRLNSLWESAWHRKRPLRALLWSLYSAQLLFAVGALLAFGLVVRPL